MNQKRINMRYKYITIMISGLAIILAACVGKATIDPLEIGNPDNGSQIFENGTEIISRKCAGCHSLDGTVIETGSHKFPSLIGISARAGDRLPELSAVEYL